MTIVYEIVYFHNQKEFSSLLWLFLSSPAVSCMGGVVTLVQVVVCDINSMGLNKELFCVFS